MKNNVSNIYGGLLMDPLFDLFPAEILPESKAFRSLDMKTDVKEENGNYVMEVELPGVNKKDISVSYNEGYLTIEAKVERAQGDNQWFIMAIREGKNREVKRICEYLGL